MVHTWQHYIIFFLQLDNLWMMFLQAKVSGFSKVVSSLTERSVFCSVHLTADFLFLQAIFTFFYYMLLLFLQAFIVKTSTICFFVRTLLKNPAIFSCCGRFFSLRETYLWHKHRWQHSLFFILNILVSWLSV